MQTDNFAYLISSEEPVPYDPEMIEVHGARENNLKNISLNIPRNQLVVITGISGSGKSSLTFDTIYAEGRRRYMESFSAYARNFLGGMERPDVDKITGLSPVISIEQKTVSRNPRSTVGTATEIYDFLRLLYARAGIAYSYVTGKKMEKQSEDQIIDHILKNHSGQSVMILSPVVKGRKGHYREEFVQIAKAGFLRVRVDGQLQDLVPQMQLDRYKTHHIEIVIDRLEASLKDRFRLAQSVAKALNLADGTMILADEKGKDIQGFSKFLMCPDSGIAYQEPAPNTFSFNSPNGWCDNCKGFGVLFDLDAEKVCPNPELSVAGGALAPFGEFRDIGIFDDLKELLKKYKLRLTTPIQNIDPLIWKKIMYGDPSEKFSRRFAYGTLFMGIMPFIKSEIENGGEAAKDHYSPFLSSSICPECNGQRLKKEALHFKIDEKNISELTQMNLGDLSVWFENLESRLNNRQNQIAGQLLKELRKRIGFLTQIGLQYLTLDRTMQTLSGGEAQRIRLATQIGTQLVGVLYILDEPSIGLHQRDNVKLIDALKNLRDIGNSVLVVEHDKDMMLNADYLIDIGPGAGRHGGQVVAAGLPSEVMEVAESTTGSYLRGHLRIEIPEKRRNGNGQWLSLIGANGHNLQNINLHLPLGQISCITGVSGSGKSSLIHHTLYPILNKHFFRGIAKPLKYEQIVGLEHIDKVIEVDQSPIGRTPRSNPATYTGFFSDIRTLFTMLPEAKIRGYKPGRFSFNVKGGRCEDCQGAGKKVIEMEFMPDVYVVCQTCKGRRYNRETLEVRFKGKSIADVLDMRVEQACDLFENQPVIRRKLEALLQVGLGYITLGQHATTLSGGEAQRVKLATELSKKDTGRTFYIFDEPTTGLHFEDIGHLLKVMHRLADKGNTVLIIEHNMDVIKIADHIVDMGPEGGGGGGYIVAQGRPEEVILCTQSHTGHFLKDELAAGSPSEYTPQNYPQWPPVLKEEPNIDLKVDDQNLDNAKKKKTAKEKIAKVEKTAKAEKIVEANNSSDPKAAAKASKLKSETQIAAQTETKVEAKAEKVKKAKKE